MDEKSGNHHYDDIEIVGAESKDDLVKREEMELEHANEKKSFSQLWKEYPKCVFCIVGNEFCERFSYYGMRTILTLYLVNILGYSQTTSSALYHAFIVVCYFSPILGSILADGYIGKYHTIMWVSLFYASGNVILAVAAVFAGGSGVHPALDFVGLLVIGLGTGGIKPCVSAFGGDQFKKGQEKQLESFFSVFYFSINAGSFISTILTPILRVQPCNGEDTCYSLAFGVPAILMVTAVVFFAAGTPLYKRYKSSTNVLAEFVKVQWKALKNKRKFKHIKRDYWVDHYLDDHVCANDPQCTIERCQKESFVKDVRAVLRVFVMYVPLPFFWMLYDQQGDRWTLQACVMNGKMNNVQVLPDQMGAINTILIMAFIPLFDGLIYPLVNRCVKLTYLRKMCAGGFLASAAFVVCAVIQIEINKTLPVIPDKGTSFITPLNYIEGCNVTMTFSGTLDGNAANTPINISSLPYSSDSDTTSPSLSLTSISGSNQIAALKVTPGQGTCPQLSVSQQNITYSDRGNTIVAITPDAIVWSQADLQKSTTGEGQYKIGLIYAASADVYSKLEDSSNNVEFAWCSYRCDSLPSEDCSKCVSKNADYYTEFQVAQLTGSDYVELAPKYPTWYLYVMQNGVGAYNYTNVSITIDQQGGIYLMTILQATNDYAMEAQIYQVAQPNTFSIWWQIPQYVVISAAEILFSITGLVFSFTQAPLSMKSVIMAAWLVTDAVGNLIIIFIIELNFDNQAYLYILFAAIMFVVMIIFVLMSVFYYDYVNYIFTGEETTDKDKKDKK